MKTALAIMSKVPVAGKTKTRLMEKITPEECAVFHRACLDDILDMAAGTHLASYIYWAFEGSSPISAINAEYIDAKWANSFKARQQRGHDLGERMNMITQEILREYDAVILIGCDIPEINGGQLLEAAMLLQSVDVVLGPADDGGYYLIGLKEQQPALFQGISWSTDRVLQATVDRIINNNCTCQLLEEKQDIDTWADLQAFARRGALSESAYQKLHSFKFARWLVEKYGRNEEMA